MKRILFVLVIVFVSFPALAQDSEFQEALRKAEQGDAQAQNNLGVMYATGTGVSQNHQEAVKWYRLAANQGNVFAQWFLGGMYERGTGVAQNYAKAYIWYSVAAAQGNKFLAENINRVSAQLSPQTIEQAQAQATRCFDSNFKDCD